MISQSSPQTLASQQAAFDALVAIYRVFGHLPSAHLSLSDVCPNRVDISLHDNLADFEVWREALGIDPATVERTELPSSLNLQAFGSFAGAEVHLSGFAPLYATAEQCLVGESQAVTA